VPANRLRAEVPDHVGAIDFRFDRTADGHNLNLVHVVDEFTGEALAIDCHRRITGGHSRRRPGRDVGGLAVAVGLILDQK
jgi:hypothetical protein